MYYLSFIRNPGTEYFVLHPPADYGESMETIFMSYACTFKHWATKVLGQLISETLICMFLYLSLKTCSLSLTLPVDCRYCSA